MILRAEIHCYGEQKCDLHVRPTMDPLATLSGTELLTSATSVAVPLRTSFCNATAFRACLVVSTPVSTSRSKRCPDRDRVNWRCT